ncbi:hypothetical protein GLAREA_03662 [Glarea lozoyensis ATCC 20868]|uniref:Uncharacterized protein n=2 Tax=Glarea lozoyensis TaxID=101852 RepID=S3CYM9_GLAL2|nr:uncharacterized protein GLAREA_03662 [Glarea lozoyensis ATCC 20868]EHK96197.1 hypothetical protein M7I_8105 [Glarea lozoyensis 74030]EPE30695.1 hypothetical protein GLAREA_03662 [Glarea lozoyensis ATCC 20868]
MSSFGKAHQNLNVMKGPLLQFSKEPMTGFYRDGYCNTGPEDKGNHSVAATLTDSFLDFSASKGNNLRQIGLTAGCKWCLCANRWKEALEHAKTTKDDPATQSVVPKVHLHATHERALEVLSIQDLKAHASEGEAANASTVAQSRNGNGPGGVKTGETSELANPDEMTAKSTADEKDRTPM